MTAVNAAAARARSSNEASATPVALVPPTTLVPVDTFNRADETLSDAGRWTNGIAGSSRRGLNVSSNKLACSVVDDVYRLAQQRPVRGGHGGLGADRDAAGRRTTQLRLYARLQQPGSGATRVHAAHEPARGRGEVWLERRQRRPHTLPAPVTQTRCRRHVLLLRAKGSIDRGLAQPRQLLVAPRRGTDSTYATAGSVGVGLRGTTGRVDDFGARTLGGASTPPARRLPCGALAATRQVALSWSCAELRRRLADHGLQGVPRHEPEPDGCSAIGDSRPDDATRTRRLPERHRRYYYKVAAVNANGEGPAVERGLGDADSRSSHLRAPRLRSTPSTAPTRTRSPTRVAGRTRSSPARAASPSLRTRSPVRVTTTCTAWRNNAQYGPDVEVWAQITTLPGMNNAASPVRPPAAARHRRFDGYMLRTNQLAGTDEVYLERDGQRRALRRLADDRARSSRPATLCSCGLQGLDGRGLARTTAARGRASARARTRPTPRPALRRNRPARDDRAPRRLRRSHYRRRSRHRPERSAVPAGDRGQRPGLARLDCSLLERRLGHHRLPRVPRNRPQPDRRPHPRSRRGDELPRHRAHERADLLLQGHRPERDRRERGLERGECDAERSGQRPERSAVPAGDRGQRPGLARLDCSLLERRLGHHRLPRVPRNRPQPDRRPHPRSRRGDELPRHRAHERADLLLQGHRPERDRRERGLERGECDAERSGHAPRALRSPCRRPRATPRSPRAGLLPPRTAARPSPATACTAEPLPTRPSPSPPISAW